MNLRTRYKNFLVLFLMTPLFLAAMDMPPFPQLQISASKQKPVFAGKLFIDHLKSVSSDHAYTKSNPVIYLTQNYQYPYTKQCKNIPLNMPFVHVIINLDSYLRPEVFAIMPVSKLDNCNTGSQIDFEIDKCIFRLTCTHNEKLVIKPKYFPQDIVEDRKEKVKNSFETQLLSCLKWFYAKPESSYAHNESISELIQNKILQEHRHEIDPFDRLLIAMVTDNPLILTAAISRSTYTHGKHGCSTFERLTDLVTKPTTKPYGSTFNFVMNRTTGKPSPKAPQSNPAETGRLACYYNYLENVKNVGNKSPMSKTIHAYKSAAIDDITNHRKPLDKEEISEQQAFLNNILEDCLVEFDVQEKAEMAALDNIIESCLTSLTIEETKISAENNSRPRRRDGLIGNECIIL